MPCCGPEIASFAPVAIGGGLALAGMLARKKLVSGGAKKLASAVKRAAAFAFRGGRG